MPLTVFDRKPPGGHGSYERDIAKYHVPVRNRLRPAYEVVREQNRMNAARVAKANRVLDDAVHNRPVLKVGKWAWVYNNNVNISSLRELARISLRRKMY